MLNNVNLLNTQAIVKFNICELIEGKLMVEKFSFSVFFVLILFLVGSAQACSFNCGGPYTDGNEFVLKAPSHSGFKTHEFYNMPKKAHSFSYIKSKSEARSGKAYQRVELRDGDCFPPSTGGWNDCETDRDLSLIHI